MNKDKLMKAQNILREEELSCVIITPFNDIIRSTAIGIKPLMIELRKDKQAFLGGVIADRVVGKAAALLAVLGKAEAVYGEVMSETALAALKKNHIPCEYGSLVPFIENRDRTGQCPMEQAVLQIEDPEQAFDTLEVTIAKLMQASK